MPRSAQELRFALVGCGRFGMHLGALLHQQVELAELAVVIDPDASHRQAAAERWRLPAFAALEEALDAAADRFDAVIVTSPNHCHRDQVISAARAGKHIFCEKPMALTSDDCRRMVASAREHDVRLMVGHKRRLRPAWKRLLELARQKAFGDLLAVNINGWHHHLDIPAWWLRKDEGGGLLHRAGVHDVDYLNALLGEPAWVRAVAAPPIRADAQFPETLWTTIGYASGTVGALHVSLWFRPTHFRDSFAVQLLGTRGSAELQPSRASGVTLTWHAGNDEPRQEHFDDGHDAAYREELNSFIAWVQRDEPPVLGWREGWRCVQVMEASYTSAANGGARLDLEALPAT